MSSMGTKLISYWGAYRHVLGGLTHLHRQALVMPSTSLLAYNYVAVNCVRLEINQIFTSNDHVGYFVAKWINRELQLQPGELCACRGRTVASWWSTLLDWID